MSFGRITATNLSPTVSCKLKKTLKIETTENNIIGFFASFGFGETNKELVKEFLWGKNGLKNQFSSLKWQDYGTDIVLILFEFNVNPIPQLRRNLKEIGSYRRKEKSIGIPTILDNENFFSLNESERREFLNERILFKLALVKEKVKRNKLDFNIDGLITDVQKICEKASS